MKLNQIKTFFFATLFLSALAFTFYACSESDDDPITDVNLEWTEVGQSKSISGVDNEGYPYGFSIEITGGTNGDSEIVIIDEVEGDTTILEFRATMEGIYDYILFEGDKTKPTTLVEYGADIGTIWEYTVTSGTVVRRELIEKGDLYKVAQTYPFSPYDFSVESVIWEISPQSGFQACTISYSDEPSVRIEFD